MNRVGPAIKRVFNLVSGNVEDKMIHKSIRECLRKQHLPMAFQPIVDHNANSVFGHESLSRPVYQNTSIRPDIWFQVSHQHNYSLATDMLAIRSALLQSGMASKKHESQLLFVNVIPSSLCSPRFSSELKLLCDTQSCEANQLVLEITEHVQYDPSALLGGIRALRDLGIQFALDDVGLGASNLTSIVELEPDFIKLDKGLIQGIASSGAKQKMVSQLVSYMGSGHRVIAEGVENADDLYAIRDTGVHLSQGYFWGLPQPFIVQTP